MRTHAGYRTFIAFVIALTLAAAPQVVQANHTANCSEYGYVNRLNGYASTGWSNHRFGVKATFDLQGFDLCTNPRTGEGSGSFALVNIDGPDSPLNYNTVQWGQGKCYPVGPCAGSAQMRDVYAWGVDPASPGCAGQQAMPPTPHFLDPWSTGFYSVELKANGYELKTSLRTVSLGNKCWTNWRITEFTETWDYGDANGGLAGDTFHFSSTQFKTCLGCAWQDLPDLCNAKSSGLEPVFKCAVEGASIALWTAR